MSGLASSPAHSVVPMACACIASPECRTVRFEMACCGKMAVSYTVPRRHHSCYYHLPTGSLQLLLIRQSSSFNCVPSTSRTQAHLWARILSRHTKSNVEPLQDPMKALITDAVNEQACYAPSSAHEAGSCMPGTPRARPGVTFGAGQDGSMQARPWRR